MMIGIVEKMPNAQFFQLALKSTPWTQSCMNVTTLIQR
jgi:hypothetical protein